MLSVSTLYVGGVAQDSPGGPFFFFGAPFCRAFNLKLVRITVHAHSATADQEHTVQYAQVDRLPHRSRSPVPAQSCPSGLSDSTTSSGSMPQELGPSVSVVESCCLFECRLG